MAGKILLIDDEPDVARQASDLLRGAGYEVVYVESAEQGLERVSQQPVDLIISDVVMPGLGGFGLFKEVRANEATKDIPVIIMTARGKMKDTFLSLGAEGMIAKPYEDADLLALVQKHLPGGTGAEAAGAQPAVSQKIQETKQTPETKEAPPVSSPAPAKEQSPEAPPAPDPASAQAADSDPLSAIPKGQAVLFAGAPSAALTAIPDLLQRKRVPSFFQRDVLKLPDIAVRLQPKCILLDVITEGAPSPEVVKRLRRRGELKAVPVVLFSHLDREKLSAAEKNQRQLEIQGAKANAIDSGADAYLGDFDEATFLTAMEPYIK